MPFTSAELQEFIAIWKEEFQESISLDEARYSASMLMELYALLLELVSVAPQVSESSLTDHRT